jgi:SAM-dependent methyltransferase
MESQVISKQRVTDHGEVFTGGREVNAMLDLVKSETERIDSRFLEPACGNGNFLAEILTRKLGIVEKRYAKSQIEYERYAVLAVTSIYGIDILQDNVQACRHRLLEIFDANYRRLFPDKTKDACRHAVRFILERNIIWGDALTLKTVGDQAGYIVFSEWSPVNGNQLKRRDFTFHALLRHEETREALLFPDLDKENAEQMPLFSDLGDEVFIPTPTKEFPPTHFMEVAHA